jgi:hypothetical protein
MTRPLRSAGSSEMYGSSVRFRHSPPPPGASPSPCILRALLIPLLLIIVAACAPRLHDAAASATVWADLDADSVLDGEELLVQGACLSASTRDVAPDEEFAEWLCSEPDPTSEHHTDAEGQWPGQTAVGAAAFFAGAECDDVFIYLLRVPEGYAPGGSTTFNGCHAQFPLTPGSAQ